MTEAILTLGIFAVPVLAVAIIEQRKMEAERRKRMTVQHDFAFCRFIESKQQADERTLPRPRLADESHRLSGRDLKGEIMQDEMPRIVTEG